MKENTKYDLTEEEFQRCLKTAEMAVFLDVRKSQNPTSIFVVAQPGAGKTGLRSFVEREHNKEPFIEFNPDEIAIYHKYYKEILEEFPNESHPILQRFVLPALDNYLRKKGVQLRTNIMQEGTFGSTEGYIKILDFQKNGGKEKLGPINENGERQEVMVHGGYQVDINILAVHRFESLLSSYEREQYFIEHGLPPRAVTPANHDRAYNNMLETIKIIQNKQLSDRMRVFKRGEIELEPELVYESGSDRYPNEIEAILHEREKNRIEILSNPQAYIGRIQVLKQRVLDTQNATNTQALISKIETLQQEFEQELEKYEMQEEPTN